MLGKYNAKILLGSSNQGGTLTGSLDVGASIANIFITGTVSRPDAGGTVRHNIPLAFEHIKRLELNLNGDTVMGFSSGYTLLKYLQINKFLDKTTSANAWNSNYIQLPQFRNVKTLAQKALTYLETYAGDNLSLIIEFEADVTNTTIYYQPITVANIGNGARIDVADYNIDVGHTGDLSVNNLPKIGTLTQMLVIQSEETDVAEKIVKFDKMELWVSQVNRATIYEQSLRREFEESKFRRLPTYGVLNAKAVYAGGFIAFDPSDAGDGADLNNNTTGIGLDGATSFRPRFNITDKGTNADPLLIVLMQTITANPAR